MSPLSESFRATLPPPAEEDTEATDADPTIDVPGELTFTPELLNAFQACLSEHKLHLRFFIGSWDGFDVASVWHSSPSSTADTTKRSYYDIVLTSETIYRIDSLPALLRVLRAASSVLTEKTLEQQTAGLSLDSSKLKRWEVQSMCLIAAKVLYFGVGGGVQDFIRTVEGGQEDVGEGKDNGRVETVWERKDGVGRKIMRLSWQ